MPFRPFHICLIVLFLAASAVPAGALSGRLSGIGSLRYAEYRADVEGAEDFEASHFTQQYSLLYQKNGNIIKGRGGKYRFALGGEFTSIDTRMSGAGDNEVDTSKILYDGSILFAPGGLPFRFEAYARDMHATQLLTDTLDTNRRPGELNNTILDPELVTDLNNGTHRRFGATLIVGIVNGSYLGAYRQLLSQLPRLLMDYSQEDVENLERSTPEKYRRRDLAFVSLNKKHNWFHYRFSDYKDYLNPGQDTERTTYMLGTVDHNLRREWINLTNWISISTDGSFTHSTRNNWISSETERFDFNFFGKMRRSNWLGTTFTTFQRTQEKSLRLLDKEIEIPFFLKGEIDRNTAWSARIISSSYLRGTMGANGADAETDDFYAAARLETGRQRPYNLVPFLEMELKQSSGGEGRGGRIGFELFSTRRSRAGYSIFAGYSVAAAAGTSGNTEIDYWEQVGDLRLAANLTARLRTGIDLRAIYGSGKLASDVTDRIGYAGLSNLQVSSERDRSREGEVRHLIATWFAEHSLLQPLKNRLSVTYDYLDAERSESQLIVEHSLNYDKRTWQVGMTNQLVTGDVSQTDQLNSANQNLDTGIASSKSSLAFEHSTNLSYKPNRALDGNLRFNYDFRSTDDRDVALYRLSESVRYRFFTINGIIRQLADIGETIAAERYYLGDASSTVANFTFFGTYYPTKYFYLGGNATYRAYLPGDVSEIIYKASTGLNFSKMQWALAYSRGIRAGEEEIPDRMEHRWETRLTKVF